MYLCYTKIYSVTLEDQSLTLNMFSNKTFLKKRRKKEDIQHSKPKIPDNNLSNIKDGMTKLL